MEVHEHVTALEQEGRRLIAAAGADLGAPVPTCPGWRVADLLAHVGYVHRWATGYVATGLNEMVDEPDEETMLGAAPPERERIAWVRDGHAALVGAFRRADPDLKCWTFLAAPSPLAMWARRQAHETAVHRVDAELAAGLGATPVDRALAVDGIDELLFGFFGRHAGAADPTADRLTIGLEAVDGPERWNVRVRGRSVEASGGSGECDVGVRGTASALYLLLWHRLGLDGLEVVGSARRFEEVWAPRGVTWS